MRSSALLSALGLASLSFAHAGDPLSEAMQSAGFRVPPAWIAELPPSIQVKAYRTWQETPTPPAQPPTEKTDKQLEEEDNIFYASLDPKHRQDLINDVKLGRSVVKEIKSELKESSSPNMTERVRRIGKELAEIANKNIVDVSWGDKRLNPFRYEFTVIEGKDVNAFSIPGGFIYIYEGLLNYTETDHELAGVLAHEISHASFRHIATLQREQSRLNAITLPLILIGLLAGGEAGTGIAMAGDLTSRAIGSGWSVKAEKSADLGGYQYIRNSPYEAVGLLTFMERLNFDDRGTGRVDWGIYKSHPPSRERVSAFLSMLQDSKIPVKRSVSSTTLRAIPVEERDATFSVKLMNRIVVRLAGDNASDRSLQLATELDELFDEIPSVSDFESRPDGSVYARGQLIFRPSASDVETAKKTAPEISAEVVKTLKAAAFELRYRLWDN